VNQDDSVNPSQGPYDPGAPNGWVEPPAPPRRPLGRTLTAAGLTVVVLAVAGGPLGLLWRYLSPTVPVINAGQNRIVVNDPSPEEYIASDGWFTILGFVFGLIVAISAWLVLRRHRGPWLVAGVTAGLLAAAVAAWQAGRLIGRGAYQDWRATSEAGATYQAPPDLHAYGILLVPAFAAVIILTLLAGWSNDPDLDEPGAQPGYGHDLGSSDAPFSSDWPAGPDPTTAPAPPGPGPAGPPRGGAA
jgi:hypothetical protein